MLGDFAKSIDSVRLIPSDGGVFEVSVDGKLIHSKKATGRHVEYPEVKEAVAALAR